MCENNIPTLKNLNSCDELRDFMLFHLDESLSGTADFQGDVVEFDGYAVPKEGEVIPVDDYDVNFTVGTVNRGTNTFVLTLGKFADEALGVELPAYVREELDMLFLLEHFSLEDLVKAEEGYINYESKNTDNIAESYVDVEESIDDECTSTIMTRRYDVCVDDSWMDLSFESLVFNKE